MNKLWTLALPLVVGVSSAGAQPGRDSDEPFATLSLAERMHHHGVPGLSLAVFEDGKILWARGFGLADVERQTPVAADTLFQAASISKPVAAMAALALVEEGDLGLDQDVNELLRSWKVPANGFIAEKPVTLRGLLTHTAGLTVHGFPGYGANEKLPSLVQVLDGEGAANTRAIRVDVAPGTHWRYSGGGYTVLQQMLIDVTGEPFPEFVRETVLEPLGMKASTYEQPLPASMSAKAAIAYRANGTRVRGSWHIYPEMAAAGLWTTPSDLAHFAIELQRAYHGNSRRVLGEKMAREMLTPGPNGWGLGPSLQGEGAALRFGHGGSNEGFRSRFVTYVHGGKGAVVMTNSDNGHALVDEVLEAIAARYGWPE